jgi:transglutaminase-like putative cysteine protease
MFSWGKTSATRAPVAPGPARCREIYQRYAAGLYRQVLLHPGDLAPAGPVAGDALVNERALAAMAGSIRVAQPPGTPGHRREHAGVTDTRRVRVGCEFVYAAAVDTPAVFQVEPLDAAPVTVVSPEWSTEPDAGIRRYADLYGNPCTRVMLPAGRSTLRFGASVLVPDATEDAGEDAQELPPDKLPDDVLIYTLPSRYCLPDVLGDEAWSRFGAMTAGYSRVQAICDHVNGHLTFQYGASGPLTTAADVNASGFGVCRDFTHLAISFCRALNIPARYVFGYLPQMDVPPDPAPMDFAAWMEVWLGDRWWTFDPRNNRRRKGRILIGRGRDASDVAMVTTFGAPVLESMTVQAQEEPG